MFVRGKPLKPSLIFAGKTGAYPSEAPDRLGWKGFLEKNTVAYYENPLITAVKSFIWLARGPSSEIQEMQHYLKQFEREMRFCIFTAQLIDNCRFGKFSNIFCQKNRDGTFI